MKIGGKIGGLVRFATGLLARPALVMPASVPHFNLHFVCLGPDGKIKWEENIHNLVAYVGKAFVIDTVFKGSGYTAAWFLGLKGAGAPAVGDTLATHPSWVEVAPYTGNRLAITFGTTSNSSNNAVNTASVVSYAITAAGPTTVAGGLICNVASGTSGTLYNAADFAASRSVAAGDTLNVTPTVQMN